MKIKHSHLPRYLAIVLTTSIFLISLFFVNPQAKAEDQFLPVTTSYGIESQLVGQKTNIRVLYNAFEEVLVGGDNGYLSTLSSVGQQNMDLTSQLNFGANKILAINSLSGYYFIGGTGGKLATMVYLNYYNKTKSFNDISNILNWGVQANINAIQVVKCQEADFILVAGHDGIKARLAIISPVKDADDKITSFNLGKDLSNDIQLDSKYISVIDGRLSSYSQTFTVFVGGEKANLAKIVINKDLSISSVTNLSEQLSSSGFGDDNITKTTFIQNYSDNWLIGGTNGKLIQLVDYGTGVQFVDLSSVAGFGQSEISAMNNNTIATTDGKIKHFFRDDIGDIHFYDITTNASFSGKITSLLGKELYWDSADSKLMVAGEGPKLKSIIQLAPNVTQVDDVAERSNDTVVTFHGINFTSRMKAWLSYIGPDKVETYEEIYLSSPVVTKSNILAEANFDLSDSKPGIYKLRIEDYYTKLGSRSGIVYVERENFQDPTSGNVEPDFHLRNLSNQLINFSGQSITTILPMELDHVNNWGKGLLVGGTNGRLNAFNVDTGKFVDLTNELALGTEQITMIHANLIEQGGGRHYGYYIGATGGKFIYYAPSAISGRATVRIDLSTKLNWGAQSRVTSMVWYSYIEEEQIRSYSGDTLILGGYDQNGARLAELKHVFNSTGNTFEMKDITPSLGFGANKINKLYSFDRNFSSKITIVGDKGSFAYLHPISLDDTSTGNSDLYTIDNLSADLRAHQWGDKDITNITCDAYYPNYCTIASGDGKSYLYNFEDGKNSYLNDISNILPASTRLLEGNIETYDANSYSLFAVSNESNIHLIQDPRNLAFREGFLKKDLTDILKVPFKISQLQVTTSSGGMYPEQLNQSSQQFTNAIVWIAGEGSNLAYFYQDPVYISSYDPQHMPASTKTTINLTGMGFGRVYYPYNNSFLTTNFKIYDNTFIGGGVIFTPPKVEYSFTDNKHMQVSFAAFENKYSYNEEIAKPLPPKSYGMEFYNSFSHVEGWGAPTVGTFCFTIDPSIVTKKKMDNITEDGSKFTIKFYNNLLNQVANNVKIVDTLQSDLQYKAGSSMFNDKQLTDESDTDELTRNDQELSFTIPAIEINGAGEVSFSVNNKLKEIVENEGY